MFRLLLLIVAVCTFTGCAKVEVWPVENAYQEGIEAGWFSGGAIEGVRFYRPHPYLWITVDEVVTKDASGAVTKNKVLTHKVIMLPDPEQEYVIQWDAGLGQVKPEFTLQDGWMLTTFKSDIDSKAAENMTAAASLLPVGAAILVNGQPVLPKLGLYRMQYVHRKGWTIPREPTIVPPDPSGS